MGRTGKDFRTWHVWPSVCPLCLSYLSLTCGHRMLDKISLDPIKVLNSQRKTVFLSINLHCILLLPYSSAVFLCILLSRHHFIPVPRTELGAVGDTVSVLRQLESPWEDRHTYCRVMASGFQMSALANR